MPSAHVHCTAQHARRTRMRSVAWPPAERTCAHDMKRPTTRVREHFRPGGASNASSQHLLVHALLHLALPVEPALLAQLLRLARRALNHLASIAVEPGLHTRYACRSVYQQTTDERHATCDAQQPDPILSDLIRSYPILSDPILSDLIRSDLIRSGPVRSDSVRSDPIRSDPFAARAPAHTGVKGREDRLWPAGAPGRSKRPMTANKTTVPDSPSRG